MRVSYKSKANVNNKIFGYLFAFFGVIPIIIMIALIAIESIGKSKIPDDAMWYTGWIKEVTHMESRYEWEEDSDGDEYRVKVYDCEAILEYEVEGQTYLYEYSVEGREKPLYEGEFFYVKVTPSNPDTVYAISNTKSNIGFYLGAGVFGLVGVIFVIIGLCIVRNASKQEKAMNNANQPYNMSQPYGDGQVYNNMGYYNDNQGTNYSGTSLRD